MPAPVIDTTQSILGYRAFERWVFQPSASGTVTAWTCSPLPPRLDFDPASGKISGYVETPGVYSFRLTAWNELAPSASVRYVFGIDGAVNPAQVGIPLLIDTRTRGVGLAGVTSASAAVQFLASSPLFYAKHKDDVALSIRLCRVDQNGGVSIQSHQVIGFKFALKSPDEDAIVLSTDAFGLEVVAGENIYSMNFRMESTLLDALLADNEATTLQAEFEWEIVNPSASGPQTLTQSSASFNVVLQNDIIE